MYNFEILTQGLLILLAVLLPKIIFWYFVASIIIVSIAIAKNFKDFCNGKMGWKNFFLNILLAPLLMIKELWNAIN